MIIPIQMKANAVDYSEFHTMSFIVLKVLTEKMEEKVEK